MQLAGSFEFELTNKSYSHAVMSGSQQIVSNTAPNRCGDVDIAPAIHLTHSLAGSPVVAQILGIARSVLSGPVDLADIEVARSPRGLCCRTAAVKHAANHRL